MSKEQILFTMLIALALMLASTLVTAFETGANYHGFKLLEKRFVKEVNATCFYFEHIKSGARLLKIAAQDANKTFSIAFKTVPESDCGTPHILEHSVLNGSQHFPVKSPFDVLARGSLNTFLNAMTGSDITVYPVASMNNTDYFNLMHIYLDAVFYPLIYRDPRILKQEGWHYELTERGGNPVYKGVVYNEMKGSFSSPMRELDYQIYRHIFPDNGYGYSSGGYPTAIPRLTNEAFLDFHRRYYHPANSYIFLYGDADLERELEFIDREYLSNFEKEDVRAKIPLQKPFEAMKEVTAYYPLPEGDETAGQTYLTLNFVAGENRDRALVMALNILIEVLVNHESAPLRLALQEAGIGRDVNAYVDDNKQNLFQIIVRNADPGDKAKFRDLVFRKLAEIADSGVDREMLRGVLNRMEFRLREGDDAQKGLTYNFQAMAGWFFADDPFHSLEWEKPLAVVKKSPENDYLESLIRTHLLENNHALLLTLVPKPGMEKEINDTISAELEAYKESLSGKEVEALIQETEDLIAYQKKEDSAEALATIPMLELKDIDRQAEWYDLDERKVTGIQVLHHPDFTNDVVYVNLAFDARVLPKELIPYAGLLAEVLGSLNTENYTFGELDNALNTHTGGFNARLRTYLKNRDDSNLIPKFEIASKAMNGKIEKMFELIAEITGSTRFADRERLEAVLTRHQSRLDSQIKRSGFEYTLSRARSYISNQGLFEELSGGAEYYWFITGLARDVSGQFETIGAQLARTAYLLFNRGNLIAATTCQEGDYAALAAGLEKFIDSLPDRAVERIEWDHALQAKNEGLLTASKVQYVIQGYDMKKLGYEWDGKFQVLSQILSTDWLQNQIRVIGGAYGGFARFYPNGTAFLMSYRDPNLAETLDRYNATPQYLREFEADDKTMTRYIIGTVARMDRPLTPSEKGEAAVRRYFENTTREQLQQDRDAVLAAKPAEIRAMDKLVADILAQETYCVYGNEEKLKSNEALFKELVDLTR